VHPFIKVLCNKRGHSFRNVIIKNLGRTTINYYGVRVICEKKAIFINGLDNNALLVQDFLQGSRIWNLFGFVDHIHFMNHHFIFVFIYLVFCLVG